MKGLKDKGCEVCKAYTAADMTRIAVDRGRQSTPEQYAAHDARE